jgi:lysozyme
MRSLLKFLPILLILVATAFWIIPGKEFAGCQAGRVFQKRRFNIRLPYGYSVHGIDVSRYQMHIDWKKVVSAKDGKHQIRFAWIKATQGVNREDSLFNRNWRLCGEAGLLKGAYHYFEPQQDSKKQALFFIRKVPLKSGDLPPMLDVEEQGHLTRKQLQVKVKVCLEELEKAYGVKPILYSNAKFYTDVLESKFNDHPLWIAHYYKYEISKALKWIIWQHSDKGMVPGIKGYVDFNVYRGNWESFNKLCIP